MDAADIVSSILAMKNYVYLDLALLRLTEAKLKKTSTELIHDYLFSSNFLGSDCRNFYLQIERDQMHFYISRRLVCNITSFLNKIKGKCQR